MIKIVSLFLIGMLVLAMFGRLRVPNLRKRKPTPPRVQNAHKCPDCGSYVIGSAPCPCHKIN